MIEERYALPVCAVMVTAGLAGIPIGGADVSETPREFSDGTNQLGQEILNNLERTENQGVVGCGGVACAFADVSCYVWEGSSCSEVKLYGYHWSLLRRSDGSGILISNAGSDRCDFAMDGGCRTESAGTMCVSGDVTTITHTIPDSDSASAAGCEGKTVGDRLDEVKKLLEETPGPEETSINDIQVPPNP